MQCPGGDKSIKQGLDRAGVQGPKRWQERKKRQDGEGDEHPQMPTFVQSLGGVRLRDPMDCSTPGFPVLHYLLEFAQILVHWIGNATKASCSPFSLHVNQLPHGHEEKDDEPHKKTEKTRQGRTAHVPMGSETSQGSELQTSLSPYPRLEGSPDFPLFQMTNWDSDRVKWVRKRKTNIID